MGVLGVYYAKDFIMYIAAGEVKGFCENYGELCYEFHILEKNDGFNDFEEIEGNSLAAWDIFWARPQISDISP